jgi:sec-independent protein translocase protein TatA
VCDSPPRGASVPRTAVHGVTGGLPHPGLCCTVRGMLGLRTGEILFIAFILVVVFSAARMGQLGNAVGKFVYSFKKASKGEDLVDAKTLPRSKRGQDVSDAEYTDSGPKRG